MATRNLTVSVVDLDGQPLNGVPVVVKLTANTRTSTRQILATAETAHTNIEGQALFHLLPSAELVGDVPYTLRVGSGSPFTFRMPNSDTTLHQLQN